MNEDARQQALTQEAVPDVVKAKQKAWGEKLEQVDDDRLVNRVFMKKK